MKKWISLLVMFALILSCCACNQNPGTTQPSTEAPTQATEATTPEATQAPEAAVPTIPAPDFSSINELEPNSKGVYQIHSIQGLQNIANHLDAEFELLQNIDLGGAAWTPIGTADKPFTGKLNGAYFTISNFTIDAPNADGDQGFFGVLEGNVLDLNLDNVTMTTTKDTKRVGAWAGTNNGTILRCYITEGSITADALAPNAICGSLVGLNAGDLRNGTMDVDLFCTVSGAADIGGAVGQAVDGRIQFAKNSGQLVVSDGTDKNIGLFAGTKGADAAIKGAVFLGETNTVNGELINAFVGAGDLENITDCLYRDNYKEPIDPEIQAMRDKAEAAMRAQGSIVWTVPKTLHYSCTCSLNSCAGMYQPGTEIHGVVYNHKGGSLARLEHCLDENNVLEEWAYLGDFDGFDCYIGSDCSTALLQAYWSVSASVDFYRTRFQVPGGNSGCVAVGDWAWDLGMPNLYNTFLEATGEEAMYEAYACLRKGDFIVNKVEAGGHTRMVAADAVVVRNAEGKIDATESYVLTHEQGAPRTTEPYFSSWRLDYKYSFSSIYLDWYVPGTIEEFVTGKFETPEATITDGAEGKLALTTGIVSSNFFLDSVRMVITDANGESVMDHTMFTTVGKYYDERHCDALIRSNNHFYDLGGFAQPLSKVVFKMGQTYDVSIIANLGSGDKIPVKEFSFTQGQL